MTQRGFWLVFKGGSMKRIELDERRERLHVAVQEHRRTFYWQRGQLVEPPWTRGLPPRRAVVGEYEERVVEVVLVLREWRVPRATPLKDPRCWYCERHVKNEVKAFANRCGRCGAPLGWDLFFEQRWIYMEEGLVPGALRVGA